MKIFIVRLDHGNGWINYYQPSTIKTLKNYIKLRGCIKMTIKLEDNDKYQEFTLEEFQERFKDIK